VIFVWQPREVAAEVARERFAACLHAELEVLTAALGITFEHSTASSAGIHIGSIHRRYGIRDTTPWVEYPDRGTAYAGVCEPDTAGTTLPDAELLLDRPDQSRGWSGRWAAAAWRTAGSVAVVTGPDGSPPLWFSEGPDGWALTSRVRTTASLVGRRSTIDPDAAALFVAYRYLFGAGSLLDGVRRVTARHQVLFTGTGPPTIRRYLGLGEYIEQRVRCDRWSDAVSHTATKMVERVSWQASASARPAILLSGGRDSRCVLAAAAAAGFRGPAITSGPVGSADVRLAPQVARALDVEHRDRSHAKGAGPSRALSRDAVAAWTRLAEGTVSLRQGISLRRFMARVAESGPNTAQRAGDGHDAPEEDQQLWHGFAGALTRGYYYLPRRNLSTAGSGMQALPFVRAKSLPGLRLRVPLNELIRPVLDDADADLGSTRVTMAQWLDLFFVLSHTEHWGEDLLAITDSTDWHWTPILDRTLLGAVLDSDPGRKTTGRFLEDVTLLLAPQLRPIPYESARSRWRWIWTQTAKGTLDSIARVSPGFAARLARRNVGVTANRELADFFRDYLLDDPVLWPNILEQKFLVSILEHDPTSDILWNVITVEALARSLEHRSAS
jgi:hypothetical protein